MQQTRAGQYSPSALPLESTSAKYSPGEVYLADGSHSPAPFPHQVLPQPHGAALPTRPSETVLAQLRKELSLHAPIPGMSLRRPWTQGSGNFPCSVCGMRFPSAQALGGHQNGHKELKGKGSKGGGGGKKRKHGEKESGSPGSKTKTAKRGPVVGEKNSGQHSDDNDNDNGNVVGLKDKNLHQLPLQQQQQPQQHQRQEEEEEEEEGEVLQQNDQYTTTKHNYVTDTEHGNKPWQEAKMDPPLGHIMASPLLSTHSSILADGTNEKQIISTGNLKQTSNAEASEFILNNSAHQPLNNNKQKKPPPDTMHALATSTDSSNCSPEVAVPIFPAREWLASQGSPLNPHLQHPIAACTASMHASLFPVTIQPVPQQDANVSLASEDAGGVASWFQCPEEKKDSTSVSAQALPLHSEGIEGHNMLGASTFMSPMETYRTMCSGNTSSTVYKNPQMPNVDLTLHL